jgi:hypothetical protein
MRNSAIVFLTAAAIAIICSSTESRAECFGSAPYQVCSDSYTDSNGDVHVRSWDSQGHSYSVDTESNSSPSGTEVRSYDSMGNSYSVRSWSDSSGVHSEDSLGNSCTITPSGTIIGCGQ